MFAAQSASVNSRLHRLTTHAAGRAAGFTVLLALILVVVLFPIAPSPLHVEPGDIAAETVVAPAAFSYESAVLQNQLREQARRSVREVVTYNVRTKAEQLARLTDLYNRMSSLRESPGLTRQARDQGLTQIPGLNLTASQRNAVLDFSPEQWRTIGDESTRVLGAILEEPFGTAELEDRRASVPARVAAGLTTQQAEIVVLLVKPLVEPTQRVDEEETRRARESAESNIGLSTVSYARDQVIVREGEPIDDAKLEALREAGLLDLQLESEDVLGIFAVSLLAAGALGAYLAVLRPSTIASMRRMLLVAVLVGGVTLAAKWYIPLVYPDSDRHFFAFALPVAVAPLLIASLFEVPFALLVAAVLAALTTFSAVFQPDLTGITGLRPGQAMQLSLAYLFGGVAAALAVHKAERMNQFFLAGAAVALASWLALAATWSLDTARTQEDLLWMALASSIAGLLSSVLAVGLFALLGSLFDVTTRLQLMELAQLNAPLLRRLQEEAPGTFHHSVMVGNLAERAADKIGADGLLVRVGAYYHDIGKMARPVFYVENQLGGENPHTRLEPEQSARVIQDHVRQGGELARRYHLPDSIKAFIQQHHGTMLTTYFYRIAAQTDPDVDPERFRYAGPRPQTRETALVMLADSTEAAVRASADRSQDRIDAIVENVITERLSNGQFDECDLTLRDLRVIAESFKSSLRAIYHPRIEYPPAPETPPPVPLPDGDAPANGAVGARPAEDHIPGEQRTEAAQPEPAAGEAEDSEQSEPEPTPAAPA